MRAPRVARVAQRAVQRIVHAQRAVRVQWVDERAIVDETQNAADFVVQRDGSDWVCRC